MRISRITAAGALATAALLAPQVTASAAVDAPAKALSETAVVTTEGDITVVASGETATGGWVQFTGTGHVKIDGSRVKSGGKTAAPQIASDYQTVGGGSWYYGSGRNAAGQKTCTSEYNHPSQWHGSSVWMDQWASSRQGPGTVATSYLSSYTTTTCSAYWSVG